MSIALALVAAIVYGASDFLGGLASRRAATLAVVIWSQATGLVLLAIALPLFGGHAVPGDLLWGALCGVAGAVAIASLYRGLAIGTMGIVSPISAVLGASIPVFYGLIFRGEHPTVYATIGIVAALLAVVLVSAPGRGAQLLPAGIPEALLAGLGFGAYFIALAQTRAAAGMVPLLAARATSVVLLVAGGLAFGGLANVRLARPAFALVALCGALDVSANVLYVLAAHGGLLSLVAVLTSLYPAATVALAAIVLRERLGRVQWIGVVLALGGAAVISAGK
ncbi:MAG TPA: DMT family transporter [Candidatus Lustribacter sp.]|nr:DMT family transporter [Candidatus Lustribacter sp.]